MGYGWSMDKPSAPKPLTPEQELARKEAIRALAVLLVLEITGQNYDTEPVAEPEPRAKRRGGFTEHWENVRAGRAKGRPGPGKGK